MLKRNWTDLNILRSKYVEQTDPAIFGPEYWSVLHTYSAENTYNKVWLDKFISFIPCHMCREEFEKIEKPNDSESFFQWAYKAHDKVNKKLGKKSPSLVDVFAFYYS
jgi:hypothetical protein